MRGGEGFRKGLRAWSVCTVIADATHLFAVAPSLIEMHHFVETIKKRHTHKHARKKKHFFVYMLNNLRGVDMIFLLYVLFAELQIRDTTLAMFLSLLKRKSAKRSAASNRQSSNSNTGNNNNKNVTADSKRAVDADVAVMTRQRVAVNELY